MLTGLLEAMLEPGQAARALPGLVSQAVELHLQLLDLGHISASLRRGRKLGTAGAVQVSTHDTAPAGLRSLAESSKGEQTTRTRTLV